MKCELLKAVEFCDVTQISGMSFSSVRYVIEKLPPVMPKDCTIDELEAEFNLLQVEELGPFVTGAEQADVQWVRIAAITDASGLPKFKNLSLLARHILLLPHSNAACECVFSQVPKTRTQFRSTMSAKTVESICVLKKSQNRMLSSQILYRSLAKGQRGYKKGPRIIKNIISITMIKMQS